MERSQPVVDGNDLPELKKAYEKAVSENQDTFEFKGHPLYVDYAKYVIEYLEAGAHKVKLED